MSLVPLAPPPPDYQQGWMYLAWKRIVAVVLSFTEEAVGFTISGGATSKTLTVPLDATVSGTNTGDNPGVTSVAVTGANGIGVSGSPITSSGTIGLSLGAITPTSVGIGTVASAPLHTAATVTGTGQSAWLLEYTQNATASPTGLRIQCTSSTAPSENYVQRWIVNGSNKATLDVNGNFICAGANISAGISSAALEGILSAGYQGGGTLVQINAPINFIANGYWSNKGAQLTGTMVRKASDSDYDTDFTGSVASNGSSKTFLYAKAVGADPTLSLTPNTGSTIVGSTTNSTLGNANKLQIAGTTAATNSLGISAWSADALGSRIELGKSRGAAIGTNTIVQNNDVVASVTGYGANGSTFTNLASISMEVDGTPGATNDMPGRIVFSTTPDASGTLAEAVRISQDKSVTFSGPIKLASVALSPTAPTIASGFGTTPSIASSNGTAAFTVNVGTGGTASAGVITMPTAANGWVVHVENITATAANRTDQRTVQTASTTTSVTVQNQTVSTGAALAWTASDILVITAVAY